MRNEAMKLQKELKLITAAKEEKGIKVIVAGDRSVTYLSIDGEERRDIVDLINKASKDVEKKSAAKMMEMSGGLGGLLGNMRG